MWAGGPRSRQASITLSWCLSHTHTHTHTHTHSIQGVNKCDVIPHTKLKLVSIFPTYQNSDSAVLKTICIFAYFNVTEAVQLNNGLTFLSGQQCDMWCNITVKCLGKRMLNVRFGSVVACTRTVWLIQIFLQLEFHFCQIGNYSDRNNNSAVTPNEYLRPTDMTTPTKFNRARDTS